MRADLTDPPNRLGYWSGMSARLPFPRLRTLAALPLHEAESLLTLAEHSYQLQSGQSARQGLRRMATYRRFLRLPPSFDLAEIKAAEHRRAPRQDLFRLGEMRPQGWSYALDCLVRETSAHGALIEVGWTEDLPDEFTLTVESIGLKHRCQVVRRTEKYLGVAFTAA